MIALAFMPGDQRADQEGADEREHPHVDRQHGRDDEHRDERADRDQCALLRSQSSLMFARLDDLGPALRLGRDEVAEGLAGQGRRLGAEAGPASLISGSRRPSSARLSCARRSPSACPSAPRGRTRWRPGSRARRPSALVGMSGKPGARLRARHGQRLEPAALDVHGRRAEAVEHHVDLAADQVLQRRAGALVRNVGDGGLRLQLEQLAGQVVRGAVAGRRVVELAAGVALHLGQELLEVASPAPSAG